MGISILKAESSLLTSALAGVLGASQRNSLRAEGKVYHARCQGKCPGTRVGQLLLAAMVSFALLATNGCAPEEPGMPEVIALEPFASNDAPFSTSLDVAVVSEEVACVIDSFESNIHCVNRVDGDVTVIGNEGGGPGEFERLSAIERSPDGRVVAVEGGARLAFFDQDGTLVSETAIPSLFQAQQLRGDRIFGFKLVIPDFSAGEYLPGYVPMVADVYSGEVLWERTDLADAVGRECFNEAVGAATPGGGLVFEVCSHELAFFAHWNAQIATVVASPGYIEALPNERDVSAHVDFVSGIGRYSGQMTASQEEAIVEEFREKPKDWLLKPISFAFDDQNRLWAATTRDRDGFSYFVFARKSLFP